MKKIFIALFAAVLLCTAGCSEQKAPITLGGVSDTGGDQVVDTAFLERYVTSLEVCLPGADELVFTDVSQLSSPQLMRFFLYAINNEQQPDQVGEMWLSEDGKYHVPIGEIEALLARYFEGEIPFEPTLIPGYSAPENAVVLQTVTGFGGDRYIKLLESSEEGDIRTLTVGFYTDSDLTTLQFSKTYRMTKGIENYRYLSVSKQYPEEAAAVSYVGLSEGFIGYTQNGGFYSAGGDKKMEKHMEHISPSEVLSTTYHVYNAEMPVTTTILNKQLFEAEAYRLNSTLTSIQFTPEAKALGVLYLSGEINPFPRAVVDITDGVGEDLINSVRLILAQNGADRAEINITRALLCDTDGDGTNETYVCANSKRDEKTNLPVGVAQKEDGGYVVSSGSSLYSLILKLDGTVAEVVDSKFLREGEYPYNALLFSTELLGIYDLNGDGQMELCIKNQLFDTSVVEVKSRNQSGYQTVLYNEFK